MKEQPERQEENQGEMESQSPEQGIVHDAGSGQLCQKPLRDQKDEGPS